MPHRPASAHARNLHGSPTGTGSLPSAPAACPGRPASPHSLIVISAAHRFIRDCARPPSQPRSPPNTASPCLRLSQAITKSPRGNANRARTMPQSSPLMSRNILPSGTIETVAARKPLAPNRHCLSWRFSLRYFLVQRTSSGTCVGRAARCPGGPAAKSRDREATGLFWCCHCLQEAVCGVHIDEAVHHFEGRRVPHRTRNPPHFVPPQ